MRVAYFIPLFLFSSFLFFSFDNVQTDFPLRNCLQQKRCVYLFLDFSEIEQSGFSSLNEKEKKIWIGKSYTESLFVISEHKRCYIFNINSIYFFCYIVIFSFCLPHTGKYTEQENPSHVKFDKEMTLQIDRWIKLKILKLKEESNFFLVLPFVELPTRLEIDWCFL